MSRPAQFPQVKGLSPSRIAVAIEKCPEMLRLDLHFKEHGVPTPGGYSRVGGSTCHKVMQFALNKFRSGAGLPSLQEMQDAFEPAWKAEVADLEKKGQPIIEEEDDPEKIVFSECADLVPVMYEYLMGLEPRLHPRPLLVEDWAKVRIPYELGKEKDVVPVGGIADLQMPDFRILDWKITRHKVSGLGRKKDTQMKFYGYFDHQQRKMAETEVSKVFFVRGPRLADLPRIQTVNKKTGKPLRKLTRPEGWPEKLPLDWKGPYVEPVSFTITEADREAFRDEAISVWRMCKYGTYTKNTAVFWCAPRWCAYYDGCQGGG